MPLQIYRKRPLTSVIMMILLAVVVMSSSSNNSEAATLRYPALHKEIKLPTIEEITYDFRWLGIKFGKAYLRWEEDNSSYKGKIFIKAAGIAKLFTKQIRVITVEGKRKQNDDGTIEYIPLKATQLVKRPKKKREIEVIYSESLTGDVETTTVTPPDNPKKRPRVSKEGMNKALDILTASIKLHAISLEDMPAYEVEAVAVEIHRKETNNKNSDEEIPATEKHILVYDGRRLTGIILGASKIDEEELEYLEKRKTYFQKYTAKRRLIEGYTDKEIKDFSEDEPKLNIFTQPMISRFPYFVYVDTDFGRITAIQREEEQDK